MRRQQRLHPESHTKAEASDARLNEPVAPGASRRFNDLARKLVNVPREELRHEQERYDVENSARRDRSKRKGKTMAERKIRVPGPDGKIVEGTEVPVAESTERWSEFTLEDGTVVRAKQSLTSCIRVDGQYDDEGRPVYVARGAPIVAVSFVPVNLMKKP
jgi:hypothetical protein